MRVFFRTQRTLQLICICRALEVSVPYICRCDAEEQTLRQSALEKHRFCGFNQTLKLLNQWTIARLSDSSLDSNLLPQSMIGYQYHRIP